MAVRLQLSESVLRQVAMDQARSLVTSVTRQVLNRSRVLVPVDTGRLRASGSMRVRDDGRGVVGDVVYNASYAAAVHEGTRPRVIRPRAGKYLKFSVGGRVVYARQVNHPGTRAQPFLATALAEVAGAEGLDVAVSFG